MSYFKIYAQIINNVRMVMNSTIVLKDLAKMIDHSVLQQNVTDIDILKGIEISKRYNVAAICTKPYTVPMVAEHLDKPDLLRNDDILSSGSPIISDETKLNPYASISDERLKRKEEALTKALKQNQKLMEENAIGYGNVENDATKGREEAIKVSTDAAMSIAMGYTSYVADKNSASMLNNAIDIQPGTDKIQAMRDSAYATGLARDASYLSKVKDRSDLLDSADKGEIGEFVGQGAMMLGDVMVKAPSRFTTSTPITAIPGVIKNGFDAALVWTNYCVLSQEYNRQEQLRQQLESNRIKMTTRLNNIRNELKKRQSKTQKIF